MTDAQLVAVNLYLQYELERRAVSERRTRCTVLARGVSSGQVYSTAEHR